MKLRALTAFAVLLSLAVPNTAAAKPTGHRHQGLFQLDVNLPDSNGFSMDIHAEDHRHVELTASKGAVAVQYSVLGRASSHRVDADFGSLGEVHVRLNLKPELVVPLPGKKRCGERIGFYGGSFHGKVDFTGEPGVASAHTHRGGVALIRINRVCKHPHKRLVANGLSRIIEDKAHSTEEVDLLSAKLKAEGRTVSFEALRLKGGDSSELPPTLTFLSADVSETLGPVTIDRTAFEITPAKVLRLSRRGKQPETAVAEPAKPFAGGASYSAEPGTPPSWSGDLSVPLPGADTVPLTGTGFSAELCRAFSSSGQEDDCISPPPSVVVP